MADTFDADTVNALRNAQEVGIRTEAHPDKAVPIWVVVSGNDVFIRSVRGPKGRWYKDLASGGKARLDLDGRQIDVRVTPANDRDLIERASKEYLTKYRTSPYAASIVRDEVLATTLRLQPTG